MSAAQSGGFNCPHCGQHYSLTPEQVPQYAGQSIACTVCRRQFTVPMEVGASGPVPPIPPVAQGGPVAAAGYGEPVGPAPAAGGYGQQFGQPYGSQFGPHAPMAAYATPMVAPPTSGLAIASMICGLLFFVPVITGLLGVIFGIIGLKQTSDRRMGGRGFALAGLICGAVSLFLWGGCFLSPLTGFNRAVKQARQNAQTVQCSANLRQIGQGFLGYADDHQGRYPARLGELIEFAGIAPGVFVCPMTGDTPAPGADAKTQAANLQKGGHLSYVYVGQNLNVNSAANAVLVYEKVGNHGNAGTNVLFNDGHVEWYDARKTAVLMSELNSGRNPPQIK